MISNIHPGFAYSQFQARPAMPGSPFQMFQMFQMFQSMMSSLMANMGFSEQMAMPMGQPNFGQGQPACRQSGDPNLSSFLGAAPAPIRSAPTFLRSSGPGQTAVDVARQFVGERSWDVKGRMPFFRRAGGLNLNCADFVSAALQNAGMLGKHEVNVTKLEKQLQKEGWVQIPNSEAGPGDVAITPSRGHVELCQGFGKTIGSNNSDKKQPDVQFISERALKKSMIVYRKPG